MTILPDEWRKEKKFWDHKIKGDQPVAGFHLSPLPHPNFTCHSLTALDQNSVEGDGCVNLLETKEITTETVSKTKEDSVS